MNVCSKYSKLRLSADLESRLDVEFKTAVSGGVFSGASLLISKGGANFERTWGAVESDGVAVSSSTCFDLASLTKPLVTAPLCMAAIQRGVLNLDDPLSRFFPGAVPRDKEGITVRHLLSHSSGLAPYKPFYFELIELPPELRRNALLSMILQTPLDAPPGKAANYSDLGFMLLGLILEDLMGERLDGCAQTFLFAGLGIDQLRFCPIDKPATEGGYQMPEERPDCEIRVSGLHRRASGSRYAATQLCPWRKRLLFGEVDDENAWSLNGVAGHAGLFGTAGGVFSMVSFLWNIYDGNITDPLWPKDLVRLFWTRTELVEGLSDWCLGYDTPSRKSSSAGRHFSANTIGHLGFTGVSFWLDLEKGILVILLTNRVHPTRQNDEIRQLRPVLHDMIMEALIYGK
jgi:CubicO group peptidase (beta-lactamase class C family)